MLYSPWSHRGIPSWECVPQAQIIKQHQLCSFPVDLAPRLFHLLYWLKSANPLQLGSCYSPLAREDFASSPITSHTEHATFVPCELLWSEFMFPLPTLLFLFISGSIHGEHFLKLLPNTFVDKGNLPNSSPSWGNNHHFAWIPLGIPSLFFPWLSQPKTL